jgi:RNA polymerase sigma-70 factor (ECF subfamily)
MTRSRAIDRVRSRGRHFRLLQRWHETTPADAASVTPLHELAVKECSERVRAALGHLSEKEREVLELAYFGGLTQSEIAARLRAPLGSVKSWARRGLLAMKERLKDLVE